MSTAIIIFIILALVGFTLLMVMPIRLPFKNFVAAFLWAFFCIAIATVLAIIRGA